MREAFGARKRKPFDQPSPEVSDLASQERSRKANQTYNIGKWEPPHQAERALLCLHHLVKTYGFPFVTGRTLSRELERKGLHVSNISVAMERNVELKLARRVVITDSGAAKRPQYEYSITSAGSLYVESKEVHKTDIGRWAPKLQAERALLGLHYLLKAFDLHSVTGHRLRKELKDQGLRISNVSVSMAHNVKLGLARRVVMNDGRGTRQIRYAYSISSAGSLYVASRLNRDF